MTVLKRRSRIVSFRVSHEEYEALKRRCISEGARSISDFARASACHFSNAMETLRKDLETDLKIQMLREQVSNLDREVRRLSQILKVPRLPKQAVDSVAANWEPVPAGCSEER